MVLADHHRAAHHLRHRKAGLASSYLRWTPQRVVVLALLIVAFVYYHVATRILRGGGDNDSKGAGGSGSGGNGSPQLLAPPPPSGSSSKTQQQQERKILEMMNDNHGQHHETRSTYKEWRDYAVSLARELPDVVVETLKTQDPFGVRTFERKLLESESNKQRFLTLQELQGLFPCPSSSSSSEVGGGGRITLPDQRNHDKAAAFRNGTIPYFLFFQHLRKAGGELPSFQGPHGWGDELLSCIDRDVGRPLSNFSPPTTMIHVAK
jgi:hypothetical protein